MLFHLVLAYILSPTVSILLHPRGPYMIYNFTWVVINQAGDVVNSTSKLDTVPHWPTLQVDLCVLALGADPDWGTPSTFWPHIPLEMGTNAPPACYNHRSRAALSLLPIYVCPGSH